MLASYRRYHELDLDRIICIYEQALKRDYGSRSSFVEDLYLFFNEPKACLFVWEVLGAAVAAVRCEPYRDGYLLSCLETSPEHRRNGYATELLLSLFAVQPGVYYAHVDKRNRASFELHKKLDFNVFLNHAVHVDGSVYASCYTLRR